MKRILSILLLLSSVAYGQNKATLTPTTGAWSLIGNSVAAGNVFGTINDASIRFITDNTAVAVLDSNGRFGIGVASPAELLHVAGNIRFSGSFLPNNLAGTSGQVLTSAGAGVPPTWETPVAQVYPGAGIAVSTGSAWGTSITDNSSNWNTAYTDRLKWDGGATGLTASTGRTSLGGTTIGQSVFTSTNPSAITFGRANADNTFDWLSASDFRTAIGAGTGSGTVTSVSFTGGLISVATATTTPALTVAGTSGGIPYFSSTSTWASSALLAANAIMIGGGAGTAPSTTTTGTGVLTALGINVGSAGAFVTFNGALGTPSSGTVTNLTGTASININGTVGATTPTTGAFTTLSATTSFALTGSAATATIGGGATAAELRFLEPSGSGSNYTAFKAVAQGADITYSLPPTVGGAGTVLTDVAGNGVLTWVANPSGTVTSVSFTGGLISVATATTTPAFTVAGTSGGIPYFSSTSTWASSAALAANALVIGGGAGVAPSTTTTGAGILTFLGTPSSANLASAVTGETGSGALVFGTSPDFTTGITIGSVAVPTISSTNTLTNKRITQRVGTTTSSATPTINTDNVDAYSITALATAITSFTTNLSGTPTDFQKLTIRIVDNGTARAITWGSSFQAGGVALPTTTVIGKTLTVGFIWDAVDSKWSCVASAQEL